MRFLALAIPIAVVAVLAAAPSARAADWITVTACDSVRLNNQDYVEISFDLHNLNSNNAIALITMHAIDHQTPNDTCHVIQMTAPPNWETQLRGDGGPIWLSAAFNAEIFPRHTLSGFKVVLSRPVCCYDFALFGATTDAFAIDAMCFECTLMTPAHPVTWGQIKSQYR